SEEGPHVLGRVLVSVAVEAINGVDDQQGGGLVEVALHPAKASCQQVPVVRQVQRRFQDAYWRPGAVLVLDDGPRPLAQTRGCLTCRVQHRTGGCGFAEPWPPGRYGK